MPRCGASCGATPVRARSGHGAIVGLTVQDADDGDTTTSRETLIEAAEQIEAVRADGDGLTEVVGDKGYHSNQVLVDVEVVGVRSYISEPDRGRRKWTKNPVARAAVYRNRRAFVVRAACACCHSAGNDWKGPLPISLRPEECDACTSGATRIFASGC
jgi:hypothetical protein